MKFYLKKSASESNLIMGVIYDSQFHDGRFVYSTGERIQIKNWVQPKSGGKPKKGQEDLTERLLEISKQATSYIRLNRSDLTKEGLKSHLDKLRPQEVRPTIAEIPTTPTILKLWNEWLTSIKGTVEPRTYNGYYNSYATFKTFLESERWQNIQPKDLTLIHYNRYHGYLKEIYKPNTVAKRQKHLKAFLGYVSGDLNYTIGLNTKKIKYKETSGLKLSLSEHELKAYADAELSPRLVKIRDLAIIQSNTGLRISDRKRIDKNLSGNKIKIQTKKTKTNIEIPISPAVRALLEKYNYELPKISEQHYRKGIKDIHKKLFPDKKIQVRDGSEFKEVFEWEEISSHDMVRTFITLSAQRGMGIPSIALITGKSVPTLLKHYLVPSQKIADQEMEKAWGASTLESVQ